MRRLQKLILKFIQQGLHPGKASLAVATGLTMGIFPILGPVSLFCLLLCGITRLNAPIVLGGVYAMTLIQPVLIIPFLRFGEYIFWADPMPISLVELTRRFSLDAGGALYDLDGVLYMPLWAGWSSHRFSSSQSI